MHKTLFMFRGAVGRASSHSARRVNNWVVVAARQPHPVAATKSGWAPTTTAARGGILGDCRRAGAGAFLFQTVRGHGGHGGHSHGLGQGKNDKGLEPEKDEEDGDGQDKAMFVTWLGLAKNFTMTIGKAVIGVTSNSAALVADAAHSASDMVSDVVAVATLKVARMPADKNHPYGHGKYESIGALSVSTILVTAGGGLVWHSVELIQSAEGAPIPGAAALWLSLACLVVNEAMFQVTLRAGEKARSPTVIANAWHHRADAGASAVALIGIGGSIMGFPYMDPIAGGLVGLMIAHTGGEMVWQSVADLTDTVNADEIRELERIINSVGGVASCTNVRLRKMGPYSLVDAQITVGKNLSVSAASQVAERARVAVMKDMKEVTEMLVHVSPDCKAWADVTGPSSQAVEDGIHQLRSHAEIEKDVREVLKRLKNVTRITFVHVDYLGGKVQVRCGIELDEQLRVWQAVDIARDAKTEIEVNVADVSHVNVSIDINELCWGNCGLTMGASCATSFKIRKGE